MFFENINKINKTPGRLIIKTKERKQIANTRSEISAITTEPTGLKKIIRKYMNNYKHIILKK